jgi:hypothetical protein
LYYVLYTGAKPYLRTWRPVTRRQHISMQTGHMWSLTMSQMTWSKSVTELILLTENQTLG